MICDNDLLIDDKKIVVFSHLTQRIYRLSFVLPEFAS